MTSRLGVVVLVLALLAAPRARAYEPRLAAGGELGLLFRDEAGGNRTVLPSLSPLVSYRLAPRVVLLAEYTFALSPSSSEVANVTTLHQRVLLGAEVLLPVRRAVFVVGLGAAAVIMQTSLADHATELASSTTVRPAAWAFVGLEVPFRRFALRVDVQGIAELDRLDWQPAVGVVVPLGSAR